LLHKLSLLSINYKIYKITNKIYGIKRSLESDNYKEG